MRRAGRRAALDPRPDGPERVSVTHAVLWLLLAVVSSAAAVLSFASLRDLALLCGFARGLAWLLPIVVDAGAAAGVLGWLGQVGGAASRRFARTLALVLMVTSVAGNAIVHGLGAYSLRPAWWLVVAVSAVAPAVLGAVVHLAVSVAQASTEPAESAGEDFGDRAEVADDPPDFWATAPYAATEAGRAAELIESGAGRRRLAAELGVSEHRARALLAERNGASR